MERQMQSIATINENVKAISLQLKKYSGVEKIINNMDFYKEMSIVEYLRDIGKMINVNYILEKEIVARRLSVGISYAEFSYTILQGYDYLQLFEKYNITCQSGGSDQWGNITTGLEFIRKSHGDTPACCFSCNLLLKPDGTKFGKSEGGAMYLDPEITSPYKLFQFLINQEDAMILTLLKRLTFLTKEEIENIMKEHQAAPFKRIGQKALAKAIVTDIHGKAAYDTAADISDKLFRGELKELQPNDLFDALNGTNVFEATAAQYNIVDLLVSAKVCDSKTTGRKLIEQKSVYLNDKLVSDFSFEVKKSEAYSKVPNFSFIKKGKRDYFLIK
jgi:tyrosyl-tRNA synthetase